MAIIHVDTAGLIYLSNVFHAMNETIRENTAKINTKIYELDSGWHGVSRQRYDQLFQEWNQYAYDLLRLSEEVSQHLLRTADAFDQADQV
ncbi:MAG TPA: WXG100 family type VII secretion target [Ktedonobacterales bacterium]|jgi:WXG100 family type VII secretion target